VKERTHVQKETGSAPQLSAAGHERFGFPTGLRTSLHRKSLIIFWSSTNQYKRAYDALATTTLSSKEYLFEKSGVVR
jgi:hypothetical protein